MKIVIHDYGGYPFTRQLAESLARREHHGLYIYGESTQAIQRTGERQKLENLDISPIVLERKFKKYSLLQRRNGEIEHGKKAADEIIRFKPQAVLSTNTPLDAQKIILRACTENQIKFIHWMQDAIGLATRTVLERKWGAVGGWIGRYYDGLEVRITRQSDAVVIISEDFIPLMKQWKIAEDKVKVIPNWAPLDELPVLPKKNPWAEKNGLADQFCFLYAGIIGFKHNPEVFVRLAEGFKEDDKVRVVIVAEGEAAEWLSRESERLELTNLLVLPYQPAEEFAQVLAAGDVLLGVLKQEAGAYSVPSKVLSYLCAGRAVLLSVPQNNLAARIVRENQAGLTSEPSNIDQWLNGARRLYEDQKIRERMGENARRYAEENFIIERITDQFEEIISRCLFQ